MLIPCRLYWFRIQKVRHVLPELISIVPELAIVSEILYENLFQPIIAGHPLRMAGLKISSKKLLLSKIQAAVKVGGGNSTIRGKRVEEVEEEGKEKGEEGSEERGEEGGEEGSEERG
jgi:hypothetical protein